MATGAGFSPSAGSTIDREVVCYKLTSTGDAVHTGTKRHDDALPAPGFVVFDSQGNLIDTGADGYTETTCDTCCPIALAQGCWDDGTNTGEWVSVQNVDGTVSVRDTGTGNTVDPADFSACPGPSFVTTVRDVTNESFTITGADLFSWAVRLRTGTVTLMANGDAPVTMDANETIASEARADGVLGTDEIVLNANGAGNSARVVIVRLV